MPDKRRNQRSGCWKELVRFPGLPGFSPPPPSDLCKPFKSEQHASRIVFNISHRTGPFQFSNSRTNQ